MIDGRAEQVTDDAELEPVATAFEDKYPTGPWDFVVRDGAFGGRDAGGRVLVFGAPGARPGVPKGRSLLVRRPGGASGEPTAEETLEAEIDLVSARMGHSETAGNGAVVR